MLLRMSYAKLTSASITGCWPAIKGHGRPPDDDDCWQSLQPLKQLEPLLDVSDDSNALNKSARVCLDSHTTPLNVLERAANAGSTNSIRSATSESSRAYLIVQTAADICFIHVRCLIFTRHFQLCLCAEWPSVRTAKNPIEKLTRSSVLFSALMNNSAVRV